MDDSLTILYQQLRGIGKVVREQFLPGLRDAYKAVHACEQDISEAFEAVHTGVEAVHAFEQNISEDFRALLEISQSPELPPFIEERLLHIAKTGWFLDDEMPISLILSLVEANTPQEIGDILTEYYDQSVGQIENSVCNELPGRAQILQRAFAAHRQGVFELSIPVLLAQADGIFKDAFCGNWSMAVGRTESQKKILEQARNWFEKVWLGLLTKKLPLTYTEEERKQEGFAGLNRHMVLHGEDLNYATKINALKAVSLLKYVVDGAARYH